MNKFKETFTDAFETSQHFTESQKEELKNIFLSYSDTVQNWICEDIAPIIQSWVEDKLKETKLKETIEEDKKNKKYTLSGIVLPFNRMSSNGRKYTKDSISQEVWNEFRSRVETLSGVPGVLEQRRALNDTYIDTPTSEISHIVVKAEIRDEGVYAKIQVLDTPKGNLVKQMIDAGVALYGSSRGIGWVSPADKHCTLDKLITIDLTGCSSFNPDEVHPLFINGMRLETHIHKH